MASGDAVVAAVVTRGVDVASVAHPGRRPSAHQITAMQWRVPECTVVGCSGRGRLEIDHRIDWSLTRHTRLDELEWNCGLHHDRKTHHGWALVEGTGKRPMVPPDDPRHPRHAGRPPPGDG